VNVVTATISPRGLSELHQNGRKIDLIDVRTPVEFREMHVEFARNVPLDRLDPKALIAERCGCDSEPLYLICLKGGRGEQACQKFIAAGFANVVNVDGGTAGWDAAGLPLVRGKKAFPLIQQVQITVGLLALVGAILGYIVHPYWIGLSAFVGAGLVFAGATGTCPLALLIARMPWNQLNEASGSSSAGSACCSR
jgi:rhodanese-related sulfurtransferase